MLDEEIYIQYPYNGVIPCDGNHYDHEKVRIKDLLWNHYDWFVEMDKTGASGYRAIQSRWDRSSVR